MSRKIIDGKIISQKDDNGAYLPSGLVPPTKAKRIREPSPSGINLSSLMDKHLLLLYRETKHLLTESASGGKLSKDSSYAMRENLKLIMDLKKKEKELLDNLSNEDLAKLIKEKANE